MSRVLALLCLIVVIAAACGGDRPTLVAEPRSVPTAVPASAEEAVRAVGDVPDAAETPAAAGADEVLRLAVVGQPIFDPIQVSVVEPHQMALIDLVADGLTEWDPQRNTWTPAVASEISTSDGGQTWRFGLGAAAFSDGTPIVADDVVRTFERVMANSLALPATRLEVVESVVAVDAQTVEFRLDRPFGEFPALVSSPVYGIVPAGPVDGTVSSGPFAVGVDGVLQPVAGDYSFELLAVPAEDAAVAAFEAGDADIAFVSAAYDGPVGTSTSSTVEVHFALNTASPALAGLEQRRVVVDAVSRTRVTDAAYGDGAGAIGRLVPRALACAAPCGGAVPEEPVGVGPLSVAYVDEATGREAALADAIVGELAAAGVEAVAAGRSLSAFVAEVSAGEHDLVRTGWIGLFPSADSQLAPYASTSPDNVSAYASAAFDELLQAARSSGGASLYDDARALLEDEAVVLPIARLSVRALVSERITSIELRHDGSIDLDSLRLAD